MDRMQALALLIVSAVMLVGSAPNAIRAWQDYTGTGRRRPADATGRAPLPSEALLERLAGLAGFGYQPIGEAIALHRRELERLRRAHGEPRHVAWMADMLELDADYRVRFGGRELRPLVVRAILPALIGAALTALAAVLFVTLPR